MNRFFLWYVQHFQLGSEHAETDTHGRFVCDCFGIKDLVKDLGWVSIAAYAPHTAYNSIITQVGVL